MADYFLIRTTTQAPPDTVPVPVIGTGTPDGTKFLRDDLSWQTPPGAGGGVQALYRANTTDVVANAADTYLAGSDLTIGGKIKAGTILRWHLAATKTAAGTATPTYHVRFGTTGSLADNARLTFTGSAQSGAADTAWITITAIVRSVSATSTVAGVQDLTHLLSTTGFASNETDTEVLTSGAFDNTSGSLIVGLSVNPGASGVWTFYVVTAEAVNLA